MRAGLFQAFSLAVAMTHDFPGRLPRVVVHQAFSLSFDQHWLPMAYFFQSRQTRDVKFIIVLCFFIRKFRLLRESFLAGKALQQITDYGNQPVIYKYLTLK
jgi:hypothetical protein